MVGSYGFGAFFFFFQHGILRQRVLQPMSPIDLLGHETVETAIRERFTEFVARDCQSSRWYCMDAFSHLVEWGWEMSVSRLAQTLLEPEFDLMIFDKLENLDGFLLKPCWSWNKWFAPKQEVLQVCVVWVFRRLKHNWRKIIKDWNRPPRWLWTGQTIGV